MIVHVEKMQHVSLYNKNSMMLIKNIISIMKTEFV